MVFFLDPGKYIEALDGRSPAIGRAKMVASLLTLAWRKGFSLRQGDA
jgi:hypothetical protein